MAVQPHDRPFAYVPAVYQYTALGRLVEAADEVHERGFSRARFSDYRSHAALRHIEREVCEHFGVSVGVSEADMVKAYISVHILPVLTFG